MLKNNKLLLLQNQTMVLMFDGFIIKITDRTNRTFEVELSEQRN